MQVTTIDGVYISDMHWFPSSKKGQSAGGSDLFVVSCTDGRFRLVSKAGRVEKAVDAHKGAVVSVRWNYEGTALATCGEDGVIKVSRPAACTPLPHLSHRRGAPVPRCAWSHVAAWRSGPGPQTVVVPTDSRTRQGDRPPHSAARLTRRRGRQVWSRAGMHRSTLAQMESAVYALCWGPDSDQLLFSCGKHLVIKPLQPSAKQIRWKAHEAAVLKVDWNPVNNLLVSAGEDCRYKVWDSYGRLMFTSSQYDYAITSVAWAPNGEVRPPPPPRAAQQPARLRVLVPWFETPRCRGHRPSRWGASTSCASATRRAGPCAAPPRTRAASST